MGNEQPKSHEQDLVKYICYDCMEEFIIGKTTAEKVKTLRCPFCGQSDHLNTESWMGGEDLEELELGCFGIGYEEDNQGNRVVDRLKALERALFMEKDKLTEERKKELNDYYVCEGKEHYTIDELREFSNDQIVFLDLFSLSSGGHPQKSFDPHEVKELLDTVINNLKNIAEIEDFYIDRRIGDRTANIIINICTKDSSETGLFEFIKALEGSFGTNISKSPKNMYISVIK